MSEIKLNGVVDDPSVSETFVDSPGVSGWAADNVIHVELFAIRRNPPTAKEGETARAHLRSRVALTIPAAVALQETLSHHLAELEKQGVFKRTVARPGEAKH